MPPLKTRHSLQTAPCRILSVLQHFLSLTQWMQKVSQLSKEFRAPYQSHTQRPACSILPTCSTQCTFFFLKRKNLKTKSLIVIISVPEVLVIMPLAISKFVVSSFETFSHSCLLRGAEDEKKKVLYVIVEIALFGTLWGLVMKAKIKRTSLVFFWWPWLLLLCGIFANQDG